MDPTNEAPRLISEITVLIVESDTLRKVLLEKYFRKGITQVLTFKEEDRTKVLEALYKLESL